MRLEWVLGHDHHTKVLRLLLSPVMQFLISLHLHKRRKRERRRGVSACTVSESSPIGMFGFSPLNWAGSRKAATRYARGL
jgi:hypothetical protein